VFMLRNASLATSLCAQRAFIAARRFIHRCSMCSTFAAVKRINPSVNVNAVFFCSTARTPRRKIPRSWVPEAPYSRAVCLHMYGR
jgi:hypothetical protein